MTESEKRQIPQFGGGSLSEPGEEKQKLVAVTPLTLTSSAEEYEKKEKWGRYVLSHFDHFDPPPPVDGYTVRSPPLLPGVVALPFTRSNYAKICRVKERPEKCITGEYLTPFCKCSNDDDASRERVGIDSLSQLPDGALEEHRPYFIPIWLAYKRQTRQSHCFDIDDHPGSCLGAPVAPLLPFEDYNGKAGLLLELANRAIHEYNEEDCNIFKFKVLKIEKVNFSATGASSQYWITVKVLNLTLETPIGTFQIHAGVQDTDEKVIFCCHSKLLVKPGSSSCDVCFGRVPSLYDT